MLKSLSVENYALIERLEMELAAGLNIVTGETGAGKSILLGALSLALGNRADSTALKDNEHNCVVEAVFDIGGYGLEEFFAANDIDFEPTATIRRIISPQGKSRSYINDIPVQLATLKELSAELIDVHSQHQMLILGSERFRTSIVDSVAGDGELTASYSELYGRLRAAEKELAAVRAESAAARRDEEYVRHQWEQVAALKLRAGEEAELEAEQQLLGNAETISGALGEVLAALDSDETGVLALLKVSEQTLRHAGTFHPSSGEWAGRVRGAIEELKDLVGEISGEVQRIEANPERLAALDGRLGAIYELFRKHGVKTSGELLELAADWERRLQAIENSDELIARLEADVAQLRGEAVDVAARITAARKGASERLSGEVEAIIACLGMPQGRFEALIEPLAELAPTGADSINFMFTANANATLQPLEKIASGGETSRVMLALKSIVARNTRLATIIFDEIDTGVSGRIADATGEIIAELGSVMQVINITHLPQVASKGETHFVVYKSDGRTAIRRLTPDERVAEIAKMLSGSTVTDAATAQARELLTVRG